MDEHGRPRKEIAAPRNDAGRRSAAGRHPAVSKGVPKGELKGKLLADEVRAGSAKVSVTTARRIAVDAEREVSPRRELPLPTENPGATDPRGGRSLRLRLLVEGERITVLDAIEVDVRAPLPERVRGTDFLEVRAGDEVLALEPLIDPGVAVGIPDPRDTTEFRGHREVELASYEVVVRVPIDAMEAIVARDLQGSPDEAKGRDRTPLEIALYRASENLVLEPSRVDMAREARGARLSRVATTGRLSLGEVRAGSGGALRKPEAQEGS